MTAALKQAPTYAFFGPEDVPAHLRHLWMCWLTPGPQRWSLVRNGPRDKGTVGNWYKGRRICVSDRGDEENWRRAFFCMVCNQTMVDQTWYRKNPTKASRAALHAHAHAHLTNVPPSHPVAALVDEWCANLLCGAAWDVGAGRPYTALMEEVADNLRGWLCPGT